MSRYVDLNKVVKSEALGLRAGLLIYMYARILKL